MPAAAHPELTPGRVYRTRDLLPFGANPTRLAKRLVQEGLLVQLAQGLFHAPETTRFGPLPPSHAEVLRAFLGTDDFLITGPSLWSVLGVGVRGARDTVTLAYNAKRSGDFRLGDQLFRLRRVRYPEKPTREWFLVDLLEHPEDAGVDLATLEDPLVLALLRKRFEPALLLAMASEYGTLDTRAWVERCIARAAPDEHEPA